MYQAAESVERFVHDAARDGTSKALDSMTSKVPIDVGSQTFSNRLKVLVVVSDDTWKEVGSSVCCESLKIPMSLACIKVPIIFREVSNRFGDEPFPCKA